MSRILYHGTSKENGRRISQGGFNCSQSGMLGKGIYFAEKNKAQGFAETASSRGLGSGYCLIKCRVSLGRCAYLQKDDPCGQWRNCYDSAHVPRTRESSKEEWCVKSDSQVTILGFYDEDDDVCL